MKIRRMFATPFVITTACSGPATPPPAKPIAATTTTPPDAAVIAADAAPAPDAPLPGLPAWDGTGTPPKRSDWEVRRTGTTCTSRQVVDMTQYCEPGASCNPPFPVAFACPAGLADGDELAIVRYDDACFVVEPNKPAKPIACPPSHR